MKKLLLLGILALVVFLGCNFVARDFYLGENDFPEEGKGMLVLVLDSSAIPKETIQPDPTDITMEANSFDITLRCTSPTGIPDIDVVNYTGAIYANHGITPGNWTVAITAYDSVDPDPDDATDPRKVVGALGGDTTTFSSVGYIGEGNTVIFGDQDGEDLSIIPIDAPGDLSIDLIWQDGIIQTNADVDAYLIPAADIPGFLAAPGSYSANMLDFNIPTAQGNTASYGDKTTYNDPPGTEENAGYYGLFITVKDGTTPVAGVVESVRIIATYESYGDMDLQATTGTLQIEWDLDLQNDVGIEFSVAGTPVTGTVTVDPTETITITATLTYPTDSSSIVDYYYQWIIDGDTATAAALADVTDTIVPIEVPYALNGVDVDGQWPNLGDEGNHQLSLLVYGLTVENDLNTISTISSESLPIAIE